MFWYFISTINVVLLISADTSYKSVALKVLIEDDWQRQKIITEEEEKKIN